MRRRVQHFDTPKKVTRAMVLTQVCAMQPGELIIRELLLKSTHRGWAGGTHTLPVRFGSKQHRNREIKKLNAVLESLVKSGVISRRDVYPTQPFPAKKS